MWLGKIIARLERFCDGSSTFQIIDSTLLEILGWTCFSLLVKNTSIKTCSISVELASDKPTRSSNGWGLKGENLECLNAGNVI